MRGRYLCAVSIAALAVGTLLAGGNASENELKKLQGTWKFVAHDVDGKPLPAEKLGKLKITFTGDKWAVSEDGKVVQSGTHKFDPTKKPAHVDATVTEGEDKGTTMLGIYEMTGDKMSVCFDTKGKMRPTTLTAKEGQMAATVQREK